VRSALVALRFPEDVPFDVVAVTPEQLRARAPHEVSRSETMNYRTMAPEPGGLFDPQVFGPGTVIDAPVPSGDDMIKPRRTWFARLPLTVPMVNPLLVDHACGQLAELTGRDATALAKASTDLADSRALVAELEAKHPWMIVRELAVLPPDLRPLKLDEHMRWALTPINMWYQRIVDRNARLKRQLEQGTPDAQLESDWTNIQVAVRGLFENDEANAPMLDAEGEPMPSLRTLAASTQKLVATLSEIAAQGAPLAIDAPRASTAEMAAADLVPARHYIAKAVLFALGFELASTRG